MTVQLPFEQANPLEVAPLLRRLQRDGVVHAVRTAVGDQAWLVTGYEEVRPHLTFGHGARYCLGAPLARTELQAVFSQLPARFPKMRLKVPARQLRLRRDTVTGGLAELPVEWQYPRQNGSLPHSREAAATTPEFAGPAEDTLATHSPGSGRSSGIRAGGLLGVSQAE
jgi:hypothetical protein